MFKILIQCIFGRVTKFEHNLTVKSPDLASNFKIDFSRSPNNILMLFDERNAMAFLFFVSLHDKSCKQ